MSCILLAILTVVLTAAQPSDPLAKDKPPTFAERAEIARCISPVIVVEWLIVPGLEVFDQAVMPPEFKRFPEELIKALYSEDVVVRSAALECLAGLAWVRVFAWWRDRDDGDDLFGVALGRHAAPIRMGLEIAFKNTRGNDRLLAAVALLALANDHKAAMDSVIDELRSTDAARRQKACCIGSVRLSQSRLLTALAAATTDTELKVRSAAATALLLVGPKAASAAPAVLAYLKSRDSTTDEVLEEMRVTFVFGRPDIQCVAIGQALADLKPAVPAVLELLEGDSSNRRLIALHCLARLGSDARGAVPTLQPYLTDKDAETRLMAAATILCIDPEHVGATKELVGFIKSDDVKLRARAIKVCGEFGPKAKALVPLLTECLKDDADNAARALGKMGSLAEPAIPRLIALLSSQHEDARDASVQYAAACALVGIGKAGLTALLDHLAKPSARKSSYGYAVMHRALAEYKNDRSAVVPVLVRALDDENVTVHMEAAVVLGRLKRLAVPSREALLRESRCTDNDGDRFADMRRTLAGWALTQLTR